MASFSKHFLLILLLLTLLSSSQIQARESQLFNKIPSNNQPEYQDPNFIPQNENLPYNSESTNSYPNSKYLPKNYNTEAYVTEAEGYRGQNGHYKNEQEGFGETKLLGNYYNGQQQGMTDTRFNNNNNNYYSYNGGNSNGVMQKQGMSDTRFLESGKYFYDVSMEQNFNRGPYGENAYRGSYVNHGNSNGNNNYYNEGYQNQVDQFQNFQDEEDLP